ncbi:MAG: hypothetical protein AB7F19_02070 [Candidatus Babeliales bacterium]
MKQLSINIKGSRVKETDIERIARKLHPEIKRIQAARTTQYTTDYSSINLPSDQERYDAIHRVINEKKALKPTILVVIGIGGSNLGTLAVHQALQGVLYNQTSPELKVYFLESVDSEYVYTLQELVKNALQCKEQIILNVVTKSGTTTETIANFMLFLELLKKFNPFEYKKSIVVTTNYQSKLWHVAQQEGFTCLEIPEKVGGRYSVLSSVGLFPLGLLGIDTAALMRGARDMVDTATQENVHENQAALSAIIKYLYYEQGIRQHDFFVFGQSLYGIAQWYRQLMGESLGKTATHGGKEVHVGITPTASCGTTDLHSVGQLYLGGPSDRLITFARATDSAHAVCVPALPEYEKLVPHIQNKKFSTLMAAMFDGVLAAYAKEARPYLELVIPQLSAYYVGQVLEMYMIEMMYLGFLLHVNPFDQPHVELYKEQTRKILAHE